MDKSDLLIMIVEDDAALARALKQAIEKEGYQVKVFTNSQDCIQQHKLSPPDLLIVDCLLPTMPGVEMVSKIHQEDVKTPVIFMSGIFTDKTFIKDAIAKTNALGFFTKPFENSDLIKMIDDVLLEKTGINIPPLEQIYQRATLSPSEFVKITTAISSVHGYHLPKILLGLLKSNADLSIELKNEENEKVSHVKISDGRILEVKVEDPNSYFGRLLVEKNFVSPDELEEVLAKPSNKRIGEKLIDENLISPHIIDIINAEQMCLRLGRLVYHTNYQLTFSPIAKTSLRQGIDGKLLADYVADWIRSKCDSAWLNKFYLPRINSSFIIEKHNKAVAEQCLKHLGEQKYQNMLASFTAGKSMQDLFQAHPSEADTIHAMSHLLAALGYIYFDQNLRSEEQAIKLDRVRQLLDASEKQDYFEILGVTRRAKVSDIKKAFHDLAKIFHPDKLPPSTAPDIVLATKALFTKISLAYESLTDETRRSSYMKELETGQAQLRLQAESLFDEAKDLLQQRNYNKAKEVIENAIKLCPPTPELKLHLLWIDLALASQDKDNSKIISNVNEALNRIPPEDRHSAIYYFVKGLMQKHLGQIDLATGNMAHAVSIQPDFIEAKRELNILKLSEKNKPIDLLNADLKDVVGSLFKKK